MKFSISGVPGSASTATDGSAKLTIACDNISSGMRSAYWNGGVPALTCAPPECISCVPGTSESKDKGVGGLDERAKPGCPAAFTEQKIIVNAESLMDEGSTWLSELSGKDEKTIPLVALRLSVLLDLKRLVPRRARIPSMARGVSLNS